MPKNLSFAKQFLNQSSDNDKVVKKRKLGDSSDKILPENGGVVFDEVLAFKTDESAKFTQKIKFSGSEGIGLKGDKVFIFRIYKKDNLEEISKYQFGFDIAAVRNLKLALDKIALDENNK